MTSLNEYFSAINIGEGLPDPSLLPSQENAPSIARSKAVRSQPEVGSALLRLQIRQEFIQRVSMRPTNGPPPQHRSKKPRKITRGQYFKGR